MERRDPKTAIAADGFGPDVGPSPACRDRHRKKMNLYPSLCPIPLIPFASRLIHKLGAKSTMGPYPYATIQPGGRFYMTKRDFQVLVIGTGPGGEGAAMQAVKQGT